MPRMSICHGLLHRTSDVNAAAVAQVLLNRILAGNTKDIKVDAICDATGLVIADVRKAVADLVRCGLVELDGDATSIDALAPTGLTMHVATVVESNLFSSAGASVDGEPLMLKGPVYIGGWWYRARWTDETKRNLTIDRAVKGDPWVSVAETSVVDEKSGWAWIFEYADGGAGEPVERLRYKNEDADVLIDPRTHDGEPLFVCDLIGPGGAVHQTTNATDRDGALAAMLAWHKRASEPDDDQASDAPKKKTRKAKA